MDAALKNSLGTGHKQAGGNTSLQTNLGLTVLKQLFFGVMI